MLRQNRNHSGSSSRNGSIVNMIESQLVPADFTSTSIPGLVFHTRSGSSDPVPMMLVLNPLTRTSCPAMRSTVSVRSSPDTVRSRICRLAMFPRSTSLMNRV